MINSKACLQRWLYLPVGALSALLLGSGCAAGPDFLPPQAPTATAYTAAPLPSSTAAAPVAGGQPQRFVPGLQIPENWWRLFRSPGLDRLIRQALADSPTLAAAQAALRQAQETRQAQLGALFPAVDANLSANRQKFTGASFGQPGGPGGIFTLYNASVSVAYSLDIAGATRRGLEALQARSDYERFLLEGSHLTLAANIVTLVIQEASLRERLRATREIIGSEEEQVRLVDRQMILGGAALPDLLVQKAQLAQTETSLPALEKELALTRHQLAVLAGKPPGDAGLLPEFNLAELQLPGELPVTLPSDLVRQRPDVRASEELLHEASARIGVATANLFPKLTLSADLGTQATELTGLFSAGSGIWSLGTSLLQPIFRGGELRAQRRAALAAYDQAQAQYRETVLQAFRNVADVLAALDLDARALKAQAAAEVAARESLTLTRKQYEAGGANILAVLTAQRQYQQARITLVQARAARYADTAALFQAVGGGWWHRETE